MKLLAMTNASYNNRSVYTDPKHTAYAIAVCIDIYTGARYCAVKFVNK